MAEADRFRADWLAARAPYDDAARAPELIARLDRWRRGIPGRLTVADLAAGTGALFRALAPRIGGAQAWRLYDNDAELLATIPDTMAGWAGRHGLRLADARVEFPGDAGAAAFRAVRCDLGDGVPTALLEGVNLVAATAVLDLVSGSWVERLAAACAAAGAAVYVALSVDGRLAWQPGDADDAAMTELFRRHQARDKGFGPALGPRGGHALAEALRGAGYRVEVARADWLLGPADADMQRHMLDGWVAAATEISAPSRRRIGDWAARRRALIDAGGSRLTVGHLDVLGLPPAA